MMRVLLLFAALALAPGSARAQLPFDENPGRSERTRQDLEELLAYYEDVAVSPAYSERVRRVARERIERIRSRLTDGDFRVGDRVAIYVQGEPDLPDTVAVEAGPMIALPLFGDVSLRGVLRSEIQQHLTEYLRLYIREPVVRAKGLMRVSIQGAVTRPGFYVVPADMLLGEALMVAGGPTPAARLDELRLERGQIVLSGGADLQEAMREGRTLDQMNMQAGDQIVMPERGASVLTNIGLVVGLIGTIGFLVLQGGN